MNDKLHADMTREEVDAAMNQAKAARSSNLRPLLERLERILRDPYVANRAMAATIREAIERLSADETDGTDWKARALRAEEVLSHNLALANKNARAFQAERDSTIRKLREKYSAIEIADMTGLTRQRIHQILNEVSAEETSENVPLCEHGNPAKDQCRYCSEKASGEYQTYPGEPLAGIYEAGVGIVRLGKDDELGPNHD